MQSIISRLESTELIILDVCLFFLINTGHYTHVNGKNIGKIKIERKNIYSEGVNIFCLSPITVSHPLILSRK